MVETQIKEDFRFRKVGGGLLIFIGLPLLLITARFILPNVSSASDALFLLPGPGLLALGVWAAFPRRKAAVRMVITDGAVQTVLPSGKGWAIQLSDLRSIAITRPILGKHDRMTFDAGSDEEILDVIQLTHEAPDILHLISMRLERQGKYLEQEISPVLGAKTGVWRVRLGNPFAAKEEHAISTHGRE
jgi:hypothetical protein